MMMRRRMKKYTSDERMAGFATALVPSFAGFSFGRGRGYIIKNVRMAGKKGKRMMV
jgi:hypothetical protein